MAASIRDSWCERPCRRLTSGADPAAQSVPNVAVRGMPISGGVNMLISGRSRHHHEMSLNRFDDVHQQLHRQGRVTGTNNSL